MQLKLQFEPRLITDILSGLVFTNGPQVVAEYVANSWDAEATTVRVALPKPMSKDPIIIIDNGGGINWELFRRVGLDMAQYIDKSARESNRPIIGTKGIGRWAGFAIGRMLEFTTTDGKKATKVSFRREDMEKAKDIGNYVCDIQEIERIEEIPEGQGTVVKVYEFLERYDWPDTEKVLTELIMEFGVAPDFEIWVDEKKATPEDIPTDYMRKIEYSSPTFGLVTGFIAGLKTKPKRQKRNPGVIIRVNNRRVEGPTFLGLEDITEGKSYDKWTLRRIIGEVNANELQDAIVGLGYESFDRQNKKYNEFVEWLKGEIEEVAKTLPEEKKEDIEQKIKLNPTFQDRWRHLPLQKKSSCQQNNRDPRSQVGSCQS